MADLNRLYDPFAYDTARPVPSHWMATSDAPEQGSSVPASVDTAIIGGGFTGLSAAYHLAKEHGVAACVFDAAPIGWGASGRNGGFCGFGGSKLSDAQIARRYGADNLRRFYAVQSEAIDLVRSLLEDGIDADPQAEGEFCLAHTPRAASDFDEEAAQFKTLTGLEAPVYSKEALKQLGMHTGLAHGAMVFPKAFGLHPRKYVLGIAAKAQAAGATLCEDTPVTSVKPDGSNGWILQTPQGQTKAKRLIIATNGYSSEYLPDWMAGRYMPVVSHIMVTEPISDRLRADQGWTSHQLAYDTRTLLHYFRLLPDNRMLFGMRGTSNITPRDADTMARNVRRDFDDMFPAFKTVSASHHWNGLVCLTANLVPFVGKVAGAQNLWAGFGYHGSGVALATWAGRHLAARVAGASTTPAPAFFGATPRKFPFPSVRRHYLPLAYKYYALKDRLA
ncbi:MAG: FAD-binding oxidoreductase [Pseudomonadota bacterium]